MTILFYPSLTKLGMVIDTRELDYISNDIN
jgi:hypothetical protein